MSDDFSEHPILVECQKAYYSEVVDHVELWDENSDLSVVMELSNPVYFRRFVENSVERIAFLSNEMIILHYDALSNEMRKDPQIIRLLPKESDKMAIRSQLHHKLAMYKVAIGEYERCYIKARNKWENFEDKSFTKGKVWSSLTGGVGATAFGIFGAAIGGLLGGLVSDKLEFRSLNILLKETQDAYNNMKKVHKDSWTEVWFTYIDPIRSFVESVERYEESMKGAGNQ